MARIVDSMLCSCCAEPADIRCGRRCKCRGTTCQGSGKVARRSICSLISGVEGASLLPNDLTLQCRLACPVSPQPANPCLQALTLPVGLFLTCRSSYSSSSSTSSCCTGTATGIRTIAAAAAAALDQVPSDGAMSPVSQTSRPSGLAVWPHGCANCLIGQVMAEHAKGRYALMFLARQHTVIETVGWISSL